jgi:hypothetical protein
MQAASTGAITRRTGLPQRRGALLLDLRVGRDVLKRQHIVRRQPEHLAGVERSGELAGREYVGVERLGGLVIGNQHQSGRLTRAGRLGRADEVGKIKGARGRGQSGHTSPARAAREMATHTLEGGGVLQVRHQIADEGKNHADISLQGH